MTIRRYDENETVISSGTEFGTCLWVVMRGELKRKRGIEVFAEKLQCIAEEFVIADDPSGRFDDDIVALTECDIACIDREEFR
jgi:hypothetical protein